MKKLLGNELKMREFKAVELYQLLLPALGDEVEPDPGAVLVVRYFRPGAPGVKGALLDGLGGGRGRRRGRRGGHNGC